MKLSEIQELLDRWSEKYHEYMTLACPDMSVPASERGQKWRDDSLLIMGVPAQMACELYMALQEQADEAE